MPSPNVVVPDVTDGAALRRARCAQVRQALAQAAQARAVAKTRALAAMPLTGMGDFGASLAGAGGTAAGPNATAALFGHGYGLRPSYGGNPFTLGMLGGGRRSRPNYGGNSFTLGLLGGALGSGARRTDPSVRYQRVLRQTSDAVLAILKGASPTAPFDRALRRSARDAAKAKGEIGATQALFDAYMPAPRHDATTAAARLAAELGVPLGAGGPASTGLGYPAWRFGMAQNPYLSGRLGADLGLGGLGAGRETAGWPPRGRGPAGWAARDARSEIWPSVGGPPDGATLSAGMDTGRYETPYPAGSGYAAAMVPPHMVRDGFNSASRAAAARLAAHLGVVPPGFGGVMKVGTESPWLGVPPSLAARGYGPYAGLFNYPNRWLDLPRSKLPGSTLPESGADFRARIAMLEWPGVKHVHELHTKYDYDPEENDGKGQHGLYQLTQGQQFQMGATDGEGNWNPGYYPGISSHTEFLNDPIAQQRVFHDAMRHYDSQLSSKGAYDFLGQTITGLEGNILISEAGLLGAAHRQGAGATRDYLRHQERYGNVTENWINDRGKVSADDAEAFRRVERRLRLLQKTPYN